MEAPLQAAPLTLEEDLTSDIDGLTRYDADLATPIPVGAAGAGTTWRFTLAEGAGYGDVVIAYWCVT